MDQTFGQQDQTFGRGSLDLTFPRVLDVCPGSLIELEGVTNATALPGNADLYGMLHRIRLDVNAITPSLSTQLSLTYVMDEDSWLDYRLEHPISTNHYIKGTIGFPKV
jgi:hypothetical protein